MNEEAEEEGTGVPASMADLFFTLLAVVVLMLLSLVPAIRTPGALAPQAAQAPWQAELRVDGEKPLVLAAHGAGLYLATGAPQDIALDTVFSSAALKSALRDAAAASRPILLFVTSEGHEAAFLFDALASSAGVSTVDQVRLDRDCRFLADEAIRRFCDMSAWEPAT